MILVDTSVWIDYFRNSATRETALLDELLQKDRLATGDLIITELYQGIKTPREIKLLNEPTASLEYFDLCGRDIALKAAENYRYLRKKGQTVRKTIDVIIATFCIENHIKLIHADRDFTPFEELLGLQALH